MRTERILSVFLACMMLFSVITFAVAEEETQDIDLTELFQETAELDLESETNLFLYRRIPFSPVFPMHRASCPAFWAKVLPTCSAP